MISLNNIPLKYNYLNALNFGLMSFKDNFIDIIYFGFVKSFDTVSHPKLLIKLQSYAIKGNLLKWNSDSITDRRQYVCINKEIKSESYSICPSSGLP